MKREYIYQALAHLAIFMGAAIIVAMIYLSFYGAYCIGYYGVKP